MRYEDTPHYAEGLLAAALILLAAVAITLYVLLAGDIVGGLLAVVVLSVGYVLLFFQEVRFRQLRARIDEVGRRTK